jgi:hypothetical protein
LINNVKLHHVVDIDIQGFSDINLVRYMAV